MLGAEDLGALGPAYGEDEFDALYRSLHRRCPELAPHQLLAAALAGT